MAYLAAWQSAVVAKLQILNFHSHPPLSQIHFLKNGDLLCAKTLRDVGDNVRQTKAPLLVQVKPHTGSSFANASSAWTVGCDAIIVLSGLWAKVWCRFQEVVRVRRGGGWSKHRWVASTPLSHLNLGRLALRPLAASAATAQLPVPRISDLFRHFSFLCNLSKRGLMCLWRGRPNADGMMVSNSIFNEKFLRLTAEAVSLVGEVVVFLLLSWAGGGWPDEILYRVISKVEFIIWEEDVYIPNQESHLLSLQRMFHYNIFMNRCRQLYLWRHWPCYETRCYREARIKWWGSKCGY